MIYKLYFDEMKSELFLLIDKDFLGITNFYYFLTYKLFIETDLSANLFIIGTKWLYFKKNKIFINVFKKMNLFSNKYYTRSR